MPSKTHPKSSKAKAKPQEDQREEILQAVVLADTFETRFRPFTRDRPRCLLPLANTPLIEYTLEFLASVGVHDIILYPGNHADQVETYIKYGEHRTRLICELFTDKVTSLSASKWKRPASAFRKFTILKSTATSVGDCMRDLDNRDLITGDFLLVSGDVVSNLRLGPALVKHKARREKDKNAMMTMILRETGIDAEKHSRERKALFVIDPRADRCIHYEETGGSNAHGNGKRLLLDPDFLKTHGEIQIREDLTDCQIDICTPEVLAQWSENFDYQSLRSSFLFGVLKDYELNGKTIHTHIVTDQYASRVKNTRAYDTISKDVANGWTYPYKPDGNFLDGQTYRVTANKCYLEERVTLARTASIVKRSIVGAETSIGEGTEILSSSIGRYCRIGNNVHIKDSYLWNGVIIGDGATVVHSIIADDSEIGSQCKIGPGSLISYKTNIPSATTTSSRSKSHSKDVATAQNDPADSDSDISETSALAYHHSSANLSQSSISTLTSQSPMNGDDEREFADLEIDAQAASLDLNGDFDDPTAAAAAVHAAQAFHTEATSSILDGLQKGDAADTIFLELNGYRMSVDASQHSVRVAMIAAFMLRVVQIIRGENVMPMTPKNAVASVFTTYKSLLERVLLERSAASAPMATDSSPLNGSTRTDQIDFLLEVQRQCAGWPPSLHTPPSLNSTSGLSKVKSATDVDVGEGRNILLFVTTDLWNLGLVDEEGLEQWWDDERGIKGQGMAEVRELTGRLVEHVKDLEEETESESGEDSD